MSLKNGKTYVVKNWNIQTHSQVQTAKGHKISTTNLITTAVTWFISCNAHCASNNVPISQKQHLTLGWVTNVMTYIKPTHKKQTNILDYLVTILIDTQNLPFWNN